MKPLTQSIRDLLLQREGALTSELERVSPAPSFGQVPRRLAPDATTRSVCGFCSTGCALNVHVRDGRAVNLSPARGYPVNLGMACPKGWEALSPLEAADRAVSPLLRNERGKLVPVSWRAALETFVSRFRGIQKEHGNGAVAFLSSGQIVSEEMALLGALTKFGMGILHGDGNTRQCMATAVAAYKRTFGFDAPPFSYADFEQSDVIVLWGSNLCIAHPIMWERICRNRNKPAIIVVDPRKTETAVAATDHVALRPKSDLLLLYGIAQILIERDWVDHGFIERHTAGFAEFKETVSSFPLDQIAAETGISLPSIERIARTIHEGKKVSFWWTMGVNQSHEAVRVAEGLIALALLTGNIGRPGTGANSITGQCNAMGSRLFSNTTNLLGGHDFANAEHRKKVARVLGIDPELIPKRNGYAYDQIMEGILAGKIRGLWVIGTNTAHSWINQHDARAILDRLDFLVVQDMYVSTETARRADLVLPAAGWGEKEGTFINSERRIGVVKRVAMAPGEALADFSIFKLVAEFWGCSHLFERWSSPEQTFQIMKELTRGQPCDITGVEDYSFVDRHGGVQWPLPAGTSAEPLAERRLFEDGRFFHADGRARFIAGPPRAVPEPTDERFPFVLLTGRGSSSQWHTQTRTAKSDVLRKLSSVHPYVEISPVDAETLALAPNQWAIVESRRGTMRARVHVTHVVQPGQVFIPMHYEGTNRLTLAAFDPDSRQPSYKHCAVRVRSPTAADLPE